MSKILPLLAESPCAADQLSQRKLSEGTSQKTPALSEVLSSLVPLRFLRSEGGVTRTILFD